MCAGDIDRRTRGIYASFAVIDQSPDGGMNRSTLLLDAAILDVGTDSGQFPIYLVPQGYRVLSGEPARINRATPASSKMQ